MRQPVDHLLRFLVLAGADIVAKGLGFVATLLIIRQFGSNSLGQLSFVLSVVGYGVTIGTAGMDIYAIRQGVHSPFGLKRLTSTILLLRTAFAVAEYLALLVLAVFVPALQEVFYLVVLVGLIVFTNAITLEWVPLALQKTGVLALANVGTQAIYLSLVLAVITVESGLWAVPVAQVVAEGIVAVGLLLWVLRSGGIGWPLPLQEIPAFLRESTVIGGTKILRAGIVASDCILLGFLVDFQQLGWYAGAYKLYLVGLSLIGLYQLLLLPRLVQRASQSVQSLRSEVRGSLKMIMGFGLPMALFAVIASGWFLETLYDLSFRAATTSLQILILVGVVNLISGHFFQAQIALGQQMINFRQSTAAAAIHVVGKLCLIPLFGITGAALGTLIGEACRLLMASYAVRRNLADKALVPGDLRGPPDGQAVAAGEQLLEVAPQRCTVRQET